MNDIWNVLCAMSLVYGKIDVPKNIENPHDSKLFKRSVGKIRGQLRDYRASIDDSYLGIHVVEFLDRYEIHVDSFDPMKKPLEHLIVDSPDTIIKIPVALKTVRNIIKK